MDLTPPLFAAVLLPPEVVAAIVERLATIDVPGRRVPSANWHITLRYAGRVEQSGYERWLAAMDTGGRGGRIRIRLGGLGAFPRPGRATVVWLGVEGEGLGELAGQVDEAAEDAGLGPEERPFRPHLTLARVRPPADVRHLLAEEVGEWRFKTDRFHVMATVGGSYRRWETLNV